MINPYCLVTPYRNREIHLSKWVSHYRELIPSVPLYVIEQADDKAFNRAKLFNCFYLLEGHKFLYSIYHDVDMRLMPRTDVNEAFAYPENPTHIATFIEQFNWGVAKKPSEWKEAYPLFFGGVVALSKFQMDKSNGWSNLIYSYGIEEDLMRQNLVSCGMQIDRRKAYFNCENHERKIDALLFRKNADYLKKGMDYEIDGLKHCEFTLVSSDQKDGYTHIKVTL